MVPCLVGDRAVLAFCLLILFSLFLLLPCNFVAKNPYFVMEYLVDSRAKRVIFAAIGSFVFSASRLCGMAGRLSKLGPVVVVPMGNRLEYPLFQPVKEHQNDVPSPDVVVQAYPKPGFAHSRLGES